MARRWLACSALIVALCLALGCSETTLLPRTQVLVQIEADPSVKARATALRVSLASGKGNPSGFDSAPDQQFVIDESFRWPASLALLPRGGDAERGFRISVEALAGERVFVASRVISTFLDGQTLLLEIVLQDGCIDFMSCADDQTCQASQGLPACVSAKVDARELDVIYKAPSRPLTDAGSVSDASQSDGATLDAEPPEPADASQLEPDAAEPDAGEPDATLDAGPCVASAEDCFNGRDDDCDMLTDCVDPECNGGAVCTPDAPQLAIKVPAGNACPAGYGRSPRTLHQALSSPGCSGCTCGSASPTTCTASITGFSAPIGCFAALQPEASANTSLFACTGAPILPGYYDAMRVNSITASPGSCPVGGTPRPGPISWGSESTLCYLERKGTGCGTGNVCVPRHDARPLCSESATSCSGAELRETWYGGLTDTRSCGACSCTPTGGHCNLVHVSFGYDLDCNKDTVVLGAGGEHCGPFNNSPVALMGTPAPASCSASAPLLGSATPTAPITLCCRP